MGRTAIKRQLNTLINDLEKSKALEKPDKYAGNLLVDPVLVAGIAYWWRKLTGPKVDRWWYRPLK